MSSDEPAAALQQFVARIAAHDPDPTANLATVRLTAGGAETVIPLTTYTARALAEALHRYHDPADNGACGRCGGQLDSDLYCAACGHVEGIFGQLVSEALYRSRTESGAAPDGPAVQ
jgi:hypothetical protein